MTTEIFGFTFYYTGALVWMWALVWVPMVWGALALTRKSNLAMLSSFKRSKEIYLALKVLLLSLPWVGVITTSVEANYFCHKYAGMHVYKTIEVEGVRTNLDISWAEKRGFKFVEADGDPKYPASMWRDRLVRPGSSVREPIKEFSAPNKFANLDVELSNRTYATRAQILDGRTNEVLAEAFTIGGRYSTFDYLAMLGLSSENWGCGSKYVPESGGWGVEELIESALKPLTHADGVKK